MLESDVLWKKDKVEQGKGFGSMRGWVTIIIIFIGVDLIYNVVLASGGQQSESVIHIHISTLF